MAPFTHDRTSYGSRNDTRCIESGKSLGGVGVENRTDGNPITATMTVFTDSTFLGVANQTLRPCPHLPAGPPNGSPASPRMSVCGTPRHVAGFCFPSSPQSAPYLLRCPFLFPFCATSGPENLRQSEKRTSFPGCYCRSFPLQDGISEPSKTLMAQCCRQGPSTVDRSPITGPIQSEERTVDERVRIDRDTLNLVTRRDGED